MTTTTTVLLADNEVVWPFDYLTEFNRRSKMLKRLNHDPKARGWANLYYKYNPIAWIEDFCITYDPRNMPPLPKVMPFKLFKRQKEFIEFLWDMFRQKKNGLVEKARDIGASWLCCAFAVWLWIYWDGSAVGFGSRKEDYVDKKGDPKTLFTKIRQIITNLPPWMQPEGFNLDVHSPFMRVVNPGNTATITGEAGDNMGRGGRTSIYFKDESSHYEHPEMVEAALGDNTDVQIDISSVNGTGNIFHRRRMAGELWYPGCVIEPGKTAVFIFDWRDHPGKTQEWYDMRRTRAEEEGLLHIFAQEVDRDYAAAVEGVIIPAIWVEAAVDAHIKLGIVPNGEKVGMQDVADGGGDKNALIMRHGIVAMFGEHWTGEAGEAAKKAIPIANEFGLRELYYDSIGVGAGFKVQVNTMKDLPTWNRNLLVLPWNAGGAVLDPDKPSIPGDLGRGSPLNKDQYANLKAQSWFRVRSRFYKTYRAVVHKDPFEPTELISIDSRIKHIHQLKMELSQPVKKQNDIGKFTVDKKPNDSYSPNLADAFVACYNPTRKVSSFDVL